MALSSPAPEAGRQRGGRGVWAAISERLALHSLTYEVPAHANRLSYMLGGLTLIGLVIAIASGILLAQFYTPDPEHANHSIRRLITSVFAGSALRSIHFWAAQLVIATLALHLLRVLFWGSYRRPREANWLVGVGLFSVVMAFYFTGTILKWDQEGFEGLQHNLSIAELLGRLGAWFSEGLAQTTPLLVRLYVSHVSILPLLLGLLLVAHLFLIKQHGISPLPWQSSTTQAKAVHGGEPSSTFAWHLKKLSGYGYILLGVVLVLSVLLPATIGPEPVAGIEVTKPPWPFLPIFAIENWLGVRALFWAVVLLELLLIAVPFVDRAASAAFRDRRWLLGAASLVILAIVALGLYAWLTPPAAHIGMGE